MGKENPVLNQLINSQKTRLEGSLWSNESDREKYKFELSPNVKLFNREQENELREISSAVYAPGGFLHGSLKMFSALKESDALKGFLTGGVIWKSLSLGINKYELGVQALFNQLPLFARCDLMLQSDQNAGQTNFQIAEIEGDKIHGMGYYDGFILLNSKEIIGQISGTTFVEAIKGAVGDETIFLLVGDSERFYLAEMEKLLKPAARQAGLNLTVATEESLKINPGQNFPLEVGRSKSRWLVNIPTLNPNGHLVKPAGACGENIYDLYKDGAIYCLIPPNRFLCNKSLLGIISNGLNDPMIDQWLQEYFKWSTIQTLRKYLPTTILVTKANKNEVASLLQKEGDKWVIKKTVSSGAKGVSLTNNGNDGRGTMIADLMTAPASYILQQKVEQTPLPFWHTESGHLKHSLMYTRVELYSQYGDGGILTVGITARKSKAVHVQKDAIQIPVRFAPTQ